MFKRYLFRALLGGMLGTVASDFAAPMLVWYSTPGDSSQAMCPCASNAAHIVQLLITVQAVAAAVGAILVLIIGGLMSRSPAGHDATPAAGRTRPGAGAP